MHLFYTPDITGEIYTLNPEESKHCVRVLRLDEGEAVVLVDGRGNWFQGEIIRADAKKCQVACREKKERYGERNFRFHLAIAPTKNMDRIEWMLEKCTEMGIDEITLLNTDYSERKIVKPERLEKVMIAAMKQSLKAYLPELHSMVEFRQFTENCKESCKLIAHCYTGDKKRIDEVYTTGKDVVILIGPEGDFSEAEVDVAIRNGFQPISLGESRLRTETAGIVACHSINFINHV